MLYPFEVHLTHRNGSVPPTGYHVQHVHNYRRNEVVQSQQLYSARFPGFVEALGSFSQYGYERCKIEVKLASVKNGEVWVNREWVTNHDVHGLVQAVELHKQVPDQTGNTGVYSQVDGVWFVTAKTIKYNLGTSLADIFSWLNQWVTPRDGADDRIWLEAVLLDTNPQLDEEWING